MNLKHLDSNPLYFIGFPLIILLVLIFLFIEQHKSEVCIRTEPQLTYFPMNDMLVPIWYDVCIEWSDK